MTRTVVLEIRNDDGFAGRQPGHSPGAVGRRMRLRPSSMGNSPVRALRLWKQL